MEQQRWEDDEGNNRSKIQLVAEDVALSLKWGMGEREEEAPKKKPAGKKPAGKKPAGNGSPKARTATGRRKAAEGEEPF